MNPTVAVFGILRFPPDLIADVLPHLKTLLEATHKSDGCIAYDAALDPFDPGLIRFSELWPDRQSLDKHLQASHLAPWRTATRMYGVLERKFTAYELGDSREI